MTTPAIAPEPALTVAAPAPSPGQEVLDRLTNDSPDTWPEILREQTALAGAVGTVLHAALELRERLQHVLGLPIPQPEAPTIMPFDVDTLVGQQLRVTYLQAKETEGVLRGVIARLGI